MKETIIEKLISGTLGIISSFISILPFIHTTKGHKIPPQPTSTITNITSTSYKTNNCDEQKKKKNNIQFAKDLRDNSPAGDKISIEQW